MKTEYSPLSLYIHIPFCVRKCRYCDFLSGPVAREEQERYLQCLTGEIIREASAFCGCQVETVFVGGGTPSLVSEQWMERILRAVRDHYRMAENVEITVEVNPGTVSREKLDAYIRMGINRLSIGLQSAVDQELSELGRIHTFGEFLLTYEWAAAAGFSDINIDLMSAIPLQNEESWRYTLERVLSLKPAPTHISAYSLILEEGTYFYEHRPELPDEETDRLLYKITNDVLKENGYHRYEISNYAREGFQCRHNLVYWRRGDYAGFGAGAASLISNVRCRNSGELGTYIESGGNCREERQVLSAEEQMEEFMFLGLRLTQGISEREFYQSFGKNLQEVYPGILEKLMDQGLLLCEESGEDRRFFLSEFGLDVSNTVMAEFLF